MKVDHYVMPKYPELDALGYRPMYIDPKVGLEIYRMLTMLGSPFTKYAIWYMKKYKNYLELSRKAVTTYAYGIENLQQFGGEEKEVAYHCLTACTNAIMDRYTRLSGLPRPSDRIYYNKRFVEQCVAILIDCVDKEARDQLLRMGGHVVPYWYEKKPKRKKSLKVPINKGGGYRIERYADMYD